jgi:Domain of unknown function (DUF6438)
MRFLILAVLVLLGPITSSLIMENSNACLVFGRGADIKNTEIIIQHKSLSKEGPNYSLRIDGIDGNVEYNGLSNVKTLGKQNSKISTDDLNRIIQEFQESYFFYLKDSYGSSNKTNSQQQHQQHQQQEDQISVSLRLGDRYKNVIYTEESTVPLTLKRLVKEIEKTTNTNQLSATGSMNDLS